MTDEHLDLAAFETRHVDQSEWAPASAIALFACVTSPTSREDEVRAEWWSERLVRQVATDRAGNRSVAERLHREEQLGASLCRAAVPQRLTNRVSSPTAPRSTRCGMRMD